MGPARTSGVASLSARAVEVNREDPGEVTKIGVGRQDPKPPPGCRCANEKVRVGALDAARAAAIEEGRRLFVIGGIEGEIGEGPEMIAKREVLPFVRGAGEQLLSDRPQYHHAPLAHELGQLAHLSRVACPPAPEG
jgi:hypothetical protein